MRLLDRYSRAAKLVAALNDLEGVTCCAPTGAMYAFPSITIPAAAVEQAKKEVCVHQCRL
jgi:alanine transaminase